MPRRRKPSKQSTAAKKGWATRREKERIRAVLKAESQPSKTTRYSHPELAPKMPSPAQQSQIIRLLFQARKLGATSPEGKRAWWKAFRTAGKSNISLHEGRFYQGGKK